MLFCFDTDILNIDTLVDPCLFKFLFCFFLIHFYFILFTCAIDAVGPSHLLQNLSSNVLNVLSDLDAPGLNHEYIFIHCKKREEQSQKIKKDVLVLCTEIRH